MNTEKNKITGSRGEEIAKNFLIKKGLIFIEQNYCAHGGEIDLIMQHKKDKSFVLVEVKTRTSNAFGYGEESITPAKLRKIIKAAQAFFFKKLNLPETPYYQIDAVIVEVDGEKVSCEHLENVGGEEF